MPDDVRVCVCVEVLFHPKITFPALPWGATFSIWVCCWVDFTFFMMMMMMELCVHANRSPDRVAIERLAPLFALRVASEAAEEELSEDQISRERV